MIPYEPGDWVAFLKPFGNTQGPHPGIEERMKNLEGRLARVTSRNLSYPGWFRASVGSYMWHWEWLRPLNGEEASSLRLNETMLLRVLKLNTDFVEETAR